MSAGKIFKSIYSGCLFINFVIILLIGFVVVRAIIATTVPPFFITFTLCAVMSLFVAATTSYVLLSCSDRPSMAVVAIIFTIAEILVTIIAVISIFATRRFEAYILFSRAPIEWLQNRRWIAVVAAAILIPLHAVQIFALANLANAKITVDGSDGDDERSAYAHARRKATPYHNNKEMLSNLKRF
uniref:MARVEL domain-containing protein n=1 Tax=Panagrellus redivivus TaxID=6233 RepID=A0A7E4V3Q0_PANRE